METAIEFITTHATRKRPLVVSLDGGSGAGKSIIAQNIASAVSGVVVPGDDFFRATVPPEQWSTLSLADRRRLVMDWARLKREAIIPLIEGRIAQWHPFDFDTANRLSTRTVIRHPAPVILIDCIYSSGPELAGLIDIAILVDADPVVRRARHNAREGNDDIEWHDLWDPVEGHFFTNIRPPESFDLVISTTG